MQTLNDIFSLTTRTLAVLEHPMLRRANLGFTLNQPFAWSLINTAAVAARLLDEHGYAAEQLESEAVRDDILNNNFPVERYDQLVVKMATLRHFNRRCSGINEIGMGQINACLRPETPISLEEIKQQARDQVKIERRMGKLKPQNVTARFTQLVTDKHTTAEARKRQIQRLMDEVFFLCNRSDDMLFVGNFEQQLNAHQVYQDIQLADFDQFDYLGESLAEKLVEPIVRARDELKTLMDRSYRVQVQETGAMLNTELEALATALGINFTKIDAQNAAIDAELAMAEKSDAEMDADIDAALDNVTIDLPKEVVEPAKRHVVKSEERKKREAEEMAAAQQRAEYNAAVQARTEKARNTRNAKATSQTKANEEAEHLAAGTGRGAKERYMEAVSLASQA